MFDQIALVVGNVATDVAFEASLSLMRVGVVALQAGRLGKPDSTDAAAKNRLVCVVVALLFMGLHLTSAGSREIAAAIGALHRYGGCDESDASQLRGNLSSQRHVNRNALARDWVLLGMSTTQMLNILRASRGMQAALGVAAEANV